MQKQRKSNFTLHLSDATRLRNTCKRPHVHNSIVTEYYAYPVFTSLFCNLNCYYSWMWNRPTGQEGFSKIRLKISYSLNCDSVRSDFKYRVYL